MRSDEITIKPIGVVRCTRTDKGDENWGAVESEVVLRPDLAAGVQGLAGFSHVIVVTWLHDVGFDAARDLMRRPRGREDMPLLGIFAQRAACRPNRIGITAVRLIDVQADRVVVRGLDAIDGTPVIDIKPYGPVFDRVDDARVPEWFERLMVGYF